LAPRRVKEMAWCALIVNLTRVLNIVGVEPGSLFAQ
jgi:hypothetical protein